MYDARIDHIILHTGDIDAAESEFREQGWTVQSRADTDGSSGVEYRFVVFESGAYILLMQFTDPAKRKAHRLGSFLDGSVALVDYSITVADSAGVEAAARAAGLVPSAVAEYRNSLADGTPWALRLFTLGRGAPGGHDALPFVVADLEPRANRVPAYKAHPNGITDLRATHVAARDAAQAAGYLAAAIETDATSDGRRHTVRLSDSAVVFHPLGQRESSHQGVLRLDVVGAAGSREMQCHGAKITVIGNAAGQEGRS